LSAVLALPGLAHDVAWDIVGKPVLDLAELLDRADVGLLVELAQRRRPWVLALVDATLRHLPAVQGVDMLRSPNTAADEHEALPVEHQGADARAVGELVVVHGE